MTLDEKKTALFKLCRKFVDDNRIYTPETVHQADRVAENALDLVFEICALVGYHEPVDN